MNSYLKLRLLSLRRELLRRDRWTSRQVSAHQQHSLSLLRKYAYDNSPFYQRFHKGLFEKPLCELPVLTKAMVMENFDQLMTDRAVRLGEVEKHIATLKGDELFLNRYRVNATSGSTGLRGLFLFDHFEWVFVLASFARAASWAGATPAFARRMRLATIASTTPWHMSARAAASLNSWWVPTLRLDASERFAEITQRLNDWQPDVIVAYPSLARPLAEAQINGQLNISPRVVLTGSEVLTDFTREFIEKAWGTQPFNQYAATESAMLAAECAEHRGLHLCEDLVIVEVVDDENKPAPPETYGSKLLVTVLFNKSQPLIRYELSDMVRLSATPCSCGRPFAVVQDIQGREEEVLRLQSRGGSEVMVHPNVFHRVMDAVAVGTEWQIILEPDSLKILLTSPPDDLNDECIVESLSRELLNQEVIPPPMHVQRVKTIPRSATGKAPLIKCGSSQRDLS
jgi:putative adenylate-forming enzyme